MLPETTSEYNILPTYTAQQQTLSFLLQYFCMSYMKPQGHGQGIWIMLIVDSCYIDCYPFKDKKNETKFGRVKF